MLMVDMAHIAGLVAAGAPEPGSARRRRHHDDAQDAPRPAGRLDPVQGRARRRRSTGRFPRQQGGPLKHIIAAKAVCLRIAASELFRERQRQTIANARALGEALQSGGLDVLTGGTDVHLILVDLGMDGLDGKEAEDRLAEVGITVNRNAIPFDQRPPMRASGLRIGTPALTTRGVVEDDLREIGEVIVEALAPLRRVEAR